MKLIQRLALAVAIMCGGIAVAQEDINIRPGLKEGLKFDSANNGKTAAAPIDPNEKPSPPVGGYIFGIASAVIVLAILCYPSRK